MRENEFEKGVREKMDGFRLQPSAPVWAEVERRIRERKRRRILFFWFCSTGIILAGLGSWWMLNRDDNHIAHAVKPDIVRSDNGNNPVKEKNKTNETLKLKQVQAKGEPVKAKNDKKAGMQNIQADKLSNVNRKATTISEVSKENRPVIQKAITPLSSGSITITAGTGKKSKVPGKKNEEKQNIAGILKLPENTTIVDVKQSVPPVDKPSPVNLNTQAVAKPEVVISTDLTPSDTAIAMDAMPVPSPEPAKKTFARKSKWQTGVQLAVGGSKLTRGSISLFSNKSFDMFQSGAVSNTNPGGSYSQSFADSIPLKGPAFHAGVFARKKWGKKTAFSAGLNLAFYSGKQRVGAFVDSARRVSSPFNTDVPGGFYRTGSRAGYTNRYYYIQVPLLLHWQLNKGNKLPPVQWENGFVPSLLIGSRALVYDPAGRIFFRDKSVYNSFSLLFQTGLSATVGEDKKHPLTAGLYYNYHFTRLQKISAPDFNYLSSFGIQFHWVIKK